MSLGHAPGRAGTGPRQRAEFGVVGLQFLKDRRWEDILRVVASIHTGTVWAHDVIRMISRDGRPTVLDDAIAHHGRIPKTLHILRLVEDPDAPLRLVTAPLPTGRFAEHHAFLACTHLDLIDHLTGAIEQVTARIEEAMAPFRGVRDLIVTVPGISTGVADVFIAETGADMTGFPSPGHLASWAGTCLGANESAGRVKSTRTRPANPYLKGALGVAAMAAARTKGTYLAAKHRRIATRRGPLKAVVAVEHAMLVAIWHMINDQAPYRDPGADYYTRLNPDKITNPGHRPAHSHRLHRQPDPPTPHRPATPVNLLVRSTCQANDTSSRRPTMKPRG